MEFKITCTKRDTLFIEASSEAEAVEMAGKRPGVVQVLAAEQWPPGAPCPDCNPGGVFRFSSIGKHCRCNGVGFLAASTDGAIEKPAERTEG